MRKVLDILVAWKNLETLTDKNVNLCLFVGIYHWTFFLAVVVELSEELEADLFPKKDLVSWKLYIEWLHLPTNYLDSEDYK